MDLHCGMVVCCWSLGQGSDWGMGGAHSGRGGEGVHGIGEWERRGLGTQR